MKKFVKDSVLRGLIAMGFGPMVLGLIYLILEKTRDLQAMGVEEVCVGIFSSALLAFVCGGSNCIYGTERLPLAFKILIHGLVLYLSYLFVYLINGWLYRSAKVIWIFTGIFVIGYLLIWLAIYLIGRRNAQKLNQGLRKKQQTRTKDE